MIRYGLFQRGVSPSPEMRKKLCEAQQRRRAAIDAEHQRHLDEFIAKVQVLLDECYRRIKVQ
jgi:hypothetical protein